jgi:hypothetical protein
LPLRWSAAAWAIAAGSNQPSSVSAGLLAMAPASAASGPRNQALTGVTNPIFGR